ncbi:hypothetical protein [Mesorhizobium sp. KR9-304]|uniref:hypothetical protein n=1 Tax=Mesorhizobium sp. KR9-304 TaxID=3156614 RepID=UPI0032B36556
MRLSGVERGPNGILIEDMGFIDNLMLHGGVLSRGGTLVVGDVAEERLTPTWRRSGPCSRRRP